MSEPMFLDRTSAAAAAGVSVHYITEAIAKGTLRAKRTGTNSAGEPVGKYLIRRADLEAWFDGLADA